MGTMCGAHYEGCNLTCHSKAWGELAEDSLRHHGLTFPWIDNSAKSFAGFHQYAGEA